jgi:hypothetical protein
MNRNPLLRCSTLFVLSVGLIVGGQVYADGFSRSQMRRTIDPSERSATGSVKMQKRGDLQIFQVEIKGLGEESFAAFLGERPSFETNCCVRSLAPLDRKNARKGVWIRRLTGNGVAPPEFQRLSFFDLDDLDGTELDIASPLENNLIQSITNVVGSVTNIIVGIPVPEPGVTNFVGAILWAPLYATSENPAERSYLRTGTLTPPSDRPAPSPGASGKMKVRFNGAQGRSTLDIRAKNLTRGQVYHVWIANTNNLDTFVLIDAGTMTTSRSGSTARFLRDTRHADPLPQQARDAGDLSGRVIQIRDEFGRFIHLEGVVP